MAAAHYENFPVASRLVPARMRPHVAAVYAFARAADDFADEGDVPQAQRLAWIDQWRALRQRGPASATGRPAVGHVPAEDVRATFIAVHDTIARCRLDPQLFDDLLSAFAQDVTTTRYETWDAVLDYCRRSANPVGRLVLGIAGVRDEKRRAALRCRLHRVAARQLLAGPRRRLAHARSALRAVGPAA